MYQIPSRSSAYGQALSSLTLLLLLLLSGCSPAEQDTYRELSWDEGERPAISHSTEMAPGAGETSAAQIADTTKPADAPSDLPGSVSPANKVTPGPAGEPPETAEPPVNTGQSAPPSNTLTTSTIPPSKVEATQGNPSNVASVPDKPEVLLEPRIPRLLIPHKSFRPEGPEQALRVTFDDIDLLKVLNMEPVPENAIEMFPDWLRELNGKKVRIRGFMFPTLTQTGITYFQHVRDNEICCFGRTPKVYDRISTLMQAGKSTHYIQGRPYDVIGILRFDPVYDEGEWLQLFVLEDAIVVE